jgi:N utilization substance protein A
MKIVFDQQLIQIMALFEKITHADLKDCVNEQGQLVFIVQQNEIGKAIGKGGKNVKQLEKALKRRVKLVEYSTDVTVFVKNLFAPLVATNITDDQGVITVTPADSNTRGQMIGRGASTLRFIESIVKRHFPITEIKIEQWQKNHAV